MNLLTTSLLILSLCCHFQGCSCHDNKETKNNEKKDDRRSFKLTVIILTMNRAKSLMRLLRSIGETDFEFDDDYFDMEIHVDKSVGSQYEECVQ